MIGSHKPFQNKRTWLCFSLLQTMESSNFNNFIILNVVHFLTFILWISSALLNDVIFLSVAASFSFSLSFFPLFFSGFFLAAPSSWSSSELKKYQEFTLVHLHKLNKEITAQKQNPVDSHKPLQDKRTWLCFSFLKTIERSVYAKLRYPSLPFDKVYMEFIIVTQYT
jgi:hypothetical protein